MRITELPQAASVAQTDDLAIDVPGGRTYRVPRSILAPAPYIATIPTGQWSGSGSDRYITVTAPNVTADAMLYPFYDNASAALLNGPVWVIPAAGSFTIHTSAIPSGTVTISVLLAGIVGEAQYQVLADVYSKSQVDSIVSQLTASGTVQRINYGSSSYVAYCKSGNTVYAFVRYTPSDGAISAWSSVTIATLPTGYRPKFECRVLAATDRAASIGTTIAIGIDGSVVVASRYNAINDNGDVVASTIAYVVA